MTDSPLLTTDPTSLDRIFSADPLTLADAEIERLVAELRRRRNAFLAEEAAKSLAPKRTRAKAEPQSSAQAAQFDKPANEVTLDDLD